MAGDGCNNLRVLVALPVLNESKSLPSVLAAVRASVPNADVLVIDDGSTDGSGQVARTAGVRVCQLPFNLGVGGAMRTAFKFAQRHQYDVVVQVDADGQHDPAEIPLLIESLEGADIVLGARFAGMGQYRVAVPRRLAMALLARVLSRLAGTPLSDVTSGFRAANRRAIDVFALHYPSEYLGDTVESIVIGLRTGCVVRQVPVAMRPRAIGRSSQSTARATAYLTRAVGALLLALVRQWPVPEVSLTPSGPTRGRHHER